MRAGKTAKIVYRQMEIFITVLDIVIVVISANFIALIRPMEQVSIIISDCELFDPGTIIMPLMPRLLIIFFLFSYFSGRSLWVLAIASSPQDHVTLRPNVKYVGNMHGDEVGPLSLSKWGNPLCDVTAFDGLGETSQFPTAEWQKHAGKHWWPVCKKYATSHKRPFVPSVGGIGLLYNV